MAFLQEDDATFEAALAFLDQFGATTVEEAPSDLNKNALLVSDADQDTLKSPKRQVRRKKLTQDEKQRRKAEFNEKRKLLRKAGVYSDANKARNERAREIARLRAQSEKLQIDLQILQTRGLSRQSIDNETAVVKRGKETPITSIWQGLAEQQRRRREETERDNVLLRLAVERQRKVANNLQTQMQRRAAQLTNECASLVTTARAHHHSVDVLDFCGDVENFRGLFRRLDDAYEKMDDVFMMNGLGNMNIAAADVHVHEHGESLEFVSYKVLPFDVQTTAEATWTHFKGVEKHLANGSLYEKAEKGLDEPYTIIADFKKETVSNSSRADIHVKQVIRRYVEEDRDVVIWVSRAVPIEIKHKILQGLTYHLQGYAITKRSSESTPDREVSVLQLCYLVSLDHDADVKYNATNLQGLIKFLVTTVAQNIRAHRERIENALIDREIQGGQKSICFQ